MICRSMVHEPSNLMMVKVLINVLVSDLLAAPNWECSSTNFIYSLALSVLGIVDLCCLLQSFAWTLGLVCLIFPKLYGKTSVIATKINNNNWTLNLECPIKIQNTKWNWTCSHQSRKLSLLNITIDKACEWRETNTDTAINVECSRIDALSYKLKHIIQIQTKFIKH